METTQLLGIGIRANPYMSIRPDVEVAAVEIEER